MRDKIQRMRFKANRAIESGRGDGFAEMLLEACSMIEMFLPDEEPKPKTKKDK